MVIIQASILALLTQQVAELKAQALLLPAKIDMLVSASDKVINLDCPECPPCPGCKDYTPEFDKLRKSLKTNNAPQGYYYYGGLSMIENIYGHIIAYINRPTVVVADVMIFVLTAISIVGVVTLRRRIDDLSVAIQQLQNRITKG